MTQVPNYTVEDGDGLSVLAEITAIFGAVRDDNAGPSAPASPVAFMRWRDTSVTPAVLNIRNAANTAWVTLKADLGLDAVSGRNRIINGQGRINQRGYISGTATVGANQYTLDRWRVVTSGQSLTFTGNDAARTMTAPAGGCEQVIEGANIEGGTYVINWTGTATCTVNGTARAKGATFTLTANTNATVRFTSGTFTDVQLELGSVATPFERLPINEEVALCQRYLYQIGGVSGVPWASPGLAGAGNSRAAVFFPVTMRAAPSLGVTGTGFQATDNTLGPVTATVSLTTASPFSANLSYSHAALTANAVRSLLTSDATSFLRFDSEI